MTLYEQHFINLKCTTALCGHIFRVRMDHPGDVQPSRISDALEPEGYAIFRNKFLVQCPQCKNRACIILPGLIEMEIEKR